VAGVTAREKELAKARKRDAEDLSLDRQRRQVDSAVAAADQLAEDAQQRFMANPTDENFARRNTAESGARQARFGAQVLQDRLDRRREEIEATDPAVIAARKELVAIDEKRAEIRDKAAKAGRLPNVAERTQLSMLDEEDARQRAIIEGRKSELSKPEQDAVDRFKRDQTLLAQAERGRLLGLTDRERFREEMEQGAGADIRARAAQMKKDGAAQADIDKFMNRAIAEQAKTIAPMIEEMRMERENAMLQGPSRAALNVSDVTTTQGQAELNRLLRGDDPAKDVNLAELRKQSDFLQILIETVKNNPLPVMDN
jgi:hypothetical protein